MNEKKYRAALYARISKEDTNKAESESIKNQIDLMEAFVANHEEIEISCVRADDGFSGVNLDRPQFRLMEEEIAKGAVNCVIVKDLSRLARNFIECGKTIHNYVTYQNVRFIAINDGIDSIDPSTVEDNLLIPIKNLMNDAYLADLSVKIRSQFEVRRKKGDYVSPFVTYGYQKDPENHNKIVIDKTVAPVIEEIFKTKLEGWSAVAIAKQLNDKGVLPPLEYKRSCGVHLTIPFQRNSTCLWNHSAISRILKNPIYMGTLVQGKTCTPNHKVKTRITKPEKDWAVIPENHEPIVSKEIFEVVQTMIRRDSRKSPDHLIQYPLSGAVFCGDCLCPMTRRNNCTELNPHYIFVCSTYKKHKKCSRHTISVETVEKAVLIAINGYIENVLDTDKLLREYDSEVFTQKELQQNHTRLLQKLDEHKKTVNKKMKTYENYKMEEISKADYQIFSQHYQEKITVLEVELEKIKTDIDLLNQGNSARQQWIKNFENHQGASELTRTLVFSLVDKIEIFEDNRIAIHFLFDDVLKTMVSHLETVKKLTEAKKEVG